MPRVTGAAPVVLGKGLMTSGRGEAFVRSKGSIRRQKKA